MSSDPALGEDELERISTAYRRARQAPPGHWGSLGEPAHLAFVQQLELAVVRALGKARVGLPAAAVLDVGCGAGYYSQRLRSFGGRSVTGVDLVPELIERARAGCAGVRFEVASATDLPFAADSFDVVTQFTCLSSILDPATRRQAAREIVRVLRPGGIVVSFDMRPAPPALRGVRQLLGRTAPRGPIAVAPLGLDEIRTLFPGEVVCATYPTLHPGILARTADHPVLTALLYGVRPLRSHLLAVIRPS